MVSMVWPTLGSRTAKEQNRTERIHRVDAAYCYRHRTQRVMVCLSAGHDCELPLRDGRTVHDAGWSREFKNN